MKKKTIIVIFILLLICPFLYSEERGLQILANQLEQSTQIGKQYFLIIGIDRYEQWMPLQNPVRDAKEISNIISSRYYIDEIIELFDEEATKANIIRTFHNLQQRLEINDSLFIFYAGHGHIDNTTNSGFWIPVNAGTDQYEQANWLPNSQILGLIQNIKATHVLLISDSCFSGDLLNVTRGIAPSSFDIPYFKEAYQRTSRQVITSGASETVPDESEFTLQLKMALQKNSSSFIDPLMLFNQIRLGVSETLPLFGSLSGTGHQEGASFILFLKENDISDPGYIQADDNSIPIIDQKTEDKGPKRMEENYFSTGAGFTFIIPVGDSQDLFATGYRPIVFFNYNIVKNWGEIGIGAISGVTITATIDNYSPVYNMYTIPLGASIGYSTNFGIPFYGFAKFTGGVNLNIVSFESSAEENTTVAVPFLEPSLGIGYYFTPNINLSAYCGIRMMFFSGTTFLGVSPGISLAASF